MKFGAFEIEILSDGTFGLDGGQMFGVVPKALWEKELQADEHNRVRLGLNCLLVRTGKCNVLIETGIGDKFDAKHTVIYNIHHQPNLLDDLALHGLSPNDVDIVINTHLHFDHCGWNTRREGSNVVPTFPRARYFVQRAEWEHALYPSERDHASYIEKWFAPAEPQTMFIEGPREIVPGIRVELAPGHNRNMQCVWIESEDRKACFISDLVPTHAHLSFPWIMAFDLYPMETLESKKRLLPQLAEGRVLIVFPHDADVPTGVLTEVESKLAFQPVNVT